MKGLLFDLDGTLLNTIADLHQSTNYALKKFGFAERTLPEIQSFVGDGLRMLIVRALPDGSSKECIDMVLAEMKRHYAIHCHDLTSIYHGILPLLQECKKQHFPIAVVSNKADPLVKKLCQHFFGDLIKVAIGESDAMPRKPAADMVFSAMRELGVTEAFYIGDSDVDVKTAKNAALPCLAVSWGFRTVEQLLSAGAEEIYETPQMLQLRIMREALE